MSNDAPVWPDDTAIWSHLTDEERVLLDAARRLQNGDPGRPVGILPLSVELGWGKKRTVNRVESLTDRDLWPIPRCSRGGWRESSSKSHLSNFELAARIQMARRKKDAGSVAVDWRQREAYRLRSIHSRAVVSYQRQKAMGLYR